VSASKAEKSRFWLAYFIDEMSVGTVFEPGELHITIVTWFVSDLADEAIVNSFQQFDFGPAFDVRIGPRVKFGPKKEVMVNLVDSSELKNMHGRSLKWLEQIQPRWAVKNPYVGPDFIAHIRRRPGTRLAQGRLLNIDNLCLVKADRHDGTRTVVAKKELLRAA
jgi:2'-5' RNA ligase